MKRFAPSFTLILLTLLSACNLQTLGPNQDAEQRFDICQAALEQPTKKRAFQGYDGWFFSDLDFETSYPLMEQTAFVSELSRTLAARGVALVLVPIPSRAVVRPDVLYPGEPLEASFSAAEAEANYTAFLEALRAEGVYVVDVLSAAKNYDAKGGQTFLKRDLH